MWILQDKWPVVNSCRSFLFGHSVLGLAINVDRGHVCGGGELIAARTEIDFIEVRKAREHNLREVSLKLPKGKLICFTGVSGSGKSSLAFDTLYAEGQRRYIESLSSYARQFMGQLKKPDVDYLGGLSPAVSIEQKTGGANPRSTVGTITEIHDFLRVLFARVGRGHCPKCDRPVGAQSRESIVQRILDLGEGAKILILAPMVRGQKGEFRDFFDDLVRQGYVRARVDGQVVRLTDRLQLDRQMRHNIELVLDRVTVDGKARPRIAEAVEAALKIADGALVVVPEDNPTSELALSSQFACLDCKLNFEPLSPQMFSFNSPQGMCLDCDGLGRRLAFDDVLLVPAPDLSIRNGAVALVGPFRGMGRWRKHIFEGLAETIGFSLDVPWKSLSDDARRAFLYGTGDRHITFAWRSRGRVMYHGGHWDGIVPQAMAKYKKTSSPMHRAMYEKFMRVLDCKACGGARLNAQARHVKIGGKSIVELEAMPVSRLQTFLAETAPRQFTAVETQIATEVLKEIRTRLGFLLDVGLDYLALDRTATTLSGGEAQRIRLAGQIGSGLVGVLYVLDEPSIGLHPRDNARLLATLERLRDQGNTVIVVEHDEETMLAADHVVDFGPGPGVRGGNVVAEGAVADIVQSKESLTGGYLAGRLTIPVPLQRRPIKRTAPKPRSRSKDKSAAQSKSD